MGCRGRIKIEMKVSDRLADGSRGAGIVTERIGMNLWISLKWIADTE